MLDSRITAFIDAFTLRLQHYTIEGISSFISLGIAYSSLCILLSRLGKYIKGLL